MRLLWGLIVVCLVAATGVRPTDADSALRPAAIERANRPAVCANATRPCLHAIGGRRAHVPQLDIPATALEAPFALRTPPAHPLARLRAAGEHVPDAFTLTCSARGPPIA